jgi:hypothetical protein
MKHKNELPVPAGPMASLPPVTIQLPIYNEMYVAERLIDAVCEIDYPRELLEIQVLDDSTDETCKVAERAVRRHAEAGLDIKYLNRTDRTGYKAGALEAGMKVAKGEFIAIFDADFIPTRDFLTRTVPYFVDPKIAMVQARWGHINQDYSLLTKIQSILLDAHFVLEHGGRNRAGLFFNFNGTAGIWRRTAIADAGGDELLQVAAAPLGQGVDPDLPQGAAGHPPVEPARRRQGRGLLPPDGQLQLPADVRAIGADGALDGHPLQHGLVRDVAHRRAAVLRGDGVGGQLLHRLPARDPQGLGDPHQVHALPDVDRHRPGRQQHQGRVRGDVQQAERVRPTSGSARSTGRTS